MQKTLFTLITAVVLLASSPASAQTDVDTSGASSCAIISQNLRYGSRDTDSSDDVATLQDFLASNGYLASQPTGFFGSMTRKAVIAFQAAQGIQATPPGFVGPLTRARVQAIDCNGSGTSSGTSTTTTQPTTTTSTTQTPTTSTPPATTASTVPQVSSVGLLAEHSGIIIYGTNFTSNGNPEVDFTNTQGVLVGKKYSLDMQSISDQQIVISNLKTVTAANGLSAAFPSGAYQLQVVVTLSGTSSNKYPFTWTAAASIPTTSSSPAPVITSVHLDMAHGKVVIDGNNLSQLSSVTYTVGGQDGTLTDEYSNSQSEAVFYMDSYLENTQLGSNPSFSVVGSGGTSNQYVYSMPTIDSFSINDFSQTTNGVVHLYNVTNPTVSWSSSNTISCVSVSTGNTTTAANDFSGTQPTSGSVQLMIGNSYNNPRYLEIHCINADGVQTQSRYGYVGGKG